LIRRTSQWKMGRLMRVATPSTPLVTPSRTALSDSARKALDVNVEAQCQPVNNQSEPAVIVMVDALWAYCFLSTSKSDLINPAAVQDAIRVLKFGKAPSPRGILNRALKHLPQSCHVPPHQVI
jgi:hypothetical protein